MRAIVATAFAAVLAVTLAAAPADAKPFFKPFGHFGGPGLVFGLAGAAFAASAYGYAENCIRFEPVVDYYGNVIGRRRINVC